MVEKATDNQDRSWNRYEDEALQGLSADAQLIYLRGMRRYMDFSTGIVGGPKRRVSYQGFKETLEFLPDPASPRQRRKPKDIPTNYIRTLVKELVRAGLIEVLSKRNKFDPMEFRLLLATTGQLRPNEDTQETHKEDSQGDAQGAQQQNQQLTMKGTQADENLTGGETHIHPVYPVKKKDTNVSLLGKPNNHLTQATEVIDFLNQKTGRKYQAKHPNGQPTSTAKLVIQVLKKGYTVQNCRTVIARKNREWKDDEKMAPFIRPTTLFRLSNFENYLGECVAI